MSHKQQSFEITRCNEIRGFEELCDNRIQTAIYSCAEPNAGLDANGSQLDQLVVRQIGAKIWPNCGIYGKSTKFGTVTVLDELINLSYGPTRNSSRGVTFKTQGGGVGII